MQLQSNSALKSINFGSQINTKREAITPQIAAIYLKLNKSNRNPRQSVIDSLTDDILNGRWQETHQGIAFDEHGNLIDGQHRLLAIIKAGLINPNIIIHMLVTRGLARGAVEAIDIQAKRSFTDFQQLSGLKFDASHEATLRAMFINAPWAQARVSVPKLNEVWNLHSAVCTFTFSLFQQKKFQPGTNNAVIRAVISRAAYTQNRIRLAEFVEILQTGMATGNDDEAAVKLRNFLLSTNRKGGTSHSGNRLSLYWKVERALFCFIQRLPLRKVTEAASELFPLHGE